MNINAILIDDEPKALAILKNKIERFCSNVNVIGESKNPDEAIEMINILKPKKAILTNLHTDLDYNYLKKKLPSNIIPAHDGLKFNF